MPTVEVGESGFSGAAGGTQLGWREASGASDSLVLDDASFRGWTSRLPGAWSFETLGLSGWPRYLEALIPRADAKLLAMEEDRSRPVYLLLR